MRAAIASCAKVSALDSRVGAPPTPLWEALILRPGGMAGPPSIERISEAAAPVTIRTGLRCTRARRADLRPLLRPRSARAASMERCVDSRVTAVDLAEAGVVGDADVGEEHLVEVRAAGHLVEVTAVARDPRG